MPIYYLIVIYSLFLFLSAKLNSDFEDRKLAIKKSIIQIIIIVVIMFIFNIITSFFASIFFNEAGSVIACILEVFIPTLVLFFGIYFISRNFKYNINIPIWIYIASIISLIIACPVYVNYIKAVIITIDDAMNSLKNGSFIEVYDDLSSTSSEILLFITRVFISLPSLFLGGFLVIRKDKINRESSK